MATNLNEAWSRFGISDPIANLAEHTDPAVRGLLAAVKAYDAISHSLAEQFAGFVLIGYNLGQSAGRLETLENPSKAVQGEIQSMLVSGVAITDIQQAFQSAMRERKVTGGN